MTNLEPIGFDIPKSQAQLANAPQQLVQPDTSGLQMLSQSSKQIGESMQAQSQFAAQSTQSLQATAEAMTKSVSQTASASAKVAEIKAESAQALTRSLSSLSGTIKDFTEKAAREKAAKTKAWQDAQKAAATKELEDAQVDWVEKGRIANEGTTPYRDAISQTISKYDLTADDIATLTQRYYGPAVDYAKKAESERQESQVKIAQTQTDILVQQHRIKASAAAGLVTASITDGTDGTAARATTALDTQIAELMADEKIPLARRLTVAKEVYEVMADSITKRGLSVAEIEQKKNSFLRVSITENVALAELKAGQITYEEYQLRIKKAAVEHNISWEPADPNAGVKFVKETLATNDAINTLQQSERERAIAAINADDDTVVALATAFALDEVGYQNVKKTDAKLLDRNAKVALEVYEDFKDFRDNFKPKYDREKASLNLAIVQDREALEKWYVNASRENSSAQSSPTFTKLLELARQGDPALATVDSGGKAPITPEMAQRIHAAVGRTIQARVEQGNALDAEYQNRVARAAKYGLSLDVNAVKQTHKNFQKKREEYQTQQAAINANRLEIPGQSPNFNGGSPSKPGSARPLATTSYNGQKITLPIASASLRSATSSKLVDKASSWVGREFNPGIEAQCQAFVNSLLDGVQPGLADAIGSTKQPIDGKELPGPLIASRFFGSDKSLVFRDVNEAQPGDLVAFYGTYAPYGKDTITHVGVYVGNGQIIDRSTKSAPVRKRSLDTFGVGNYAFARPKAFENRPLANDDFVATPTQLVLKVREGSSVNSLVYGSVKVTPSGLEVLSDDGSRHVINNVGRVVVRNGQRVGPGESLALSGASSPVFQYRGSNGALLNPLMYLTSSFGDAPRQPRTAGSSPPPDAVPVFPAGAIPLGNGTYLLNGKVEKVSYKQQTITQTPARYSGAAPIRSSYTGALSEAPPSAPDANHGYAQLARDKPFAIALNAVAKKHGMPGYLLADLIAFESANSFSPSQGNGMGFYGLIQFGEAARQDLGVSLAQLTSMTPTQQMRLVDEYLKMHKRYAGVNENTPIKNAAELIALVNLGGGVYADVLKRGEAAVRDPNNNDGHIQLLQYVQRLGKFSGRKYDFPGNRQARLRASAVHTHPNDGCAMCQSLVASGQFQPHENVS